MFGLPLKKILFSYLATIFDDINNSINCYDTFKLRKRFRSVLKAHEYLPYGPFKQYDIYGNREFINIPLMGLRVFRMTFKIFFCFFATDTRTLTDAADGAHAQLELYTAEAIVVAKRKAAVSFAYTLSRHRRVY